MGGQIALIFCRLMGKVFSNSFLMNPVSNAVLIPIESGFVKAVRFFLKVSPSVGSGFLSSPGFLRVRVRSGFRCMP